MSAWPRNWEKASFLRDRIKFFRVILFLPLAIAALRLVQLQIYQHREMMERGENQSVRMVTIPAQRGEIVDRRGRPVVQNAPLFQLWATPVLLKDKQQRALVADILGISEAQLRSLFKENKLRSIGRQTLLMDNLPYSAAVRLYARADRLSDIRVQTTFQRRYRDPISLSHILGYIGEASERDRTPAGDTYSIGDRVGKSGVERQFNEQLFGRNGAEVRRVDAHGYLIGIEAYDPPRNGTDLVLSIDMELQQKAADLMAGTPGALIAIDPRTGETLAAVSDPSINLDDFRYRVDNTNWKELTNNPLRPLLNRVFQGQYPPGSTYKQVLAVAALAEGLVSAEETINCNGSYRVGRRTFRCWKKGGHGLVNLHKALRESCDSYFYEMGMRLGPNKIAHYAHLLGLGTTTGVEIANEKSGLIPTTEYKLKRFNEPWQAGETPSIAIGQGFDLVTPAQLAYMYAIIANGGIPVGLTLLPRASASVTTPSADLTGLLGPIQSGLAAVVNEPGGTGGWARLRTHKVAGKTGTAQVIAQEEPVANMADLPEEHRDHAWFVGYAPTENPRIVVAVIAEHAGHGGSAAAPIVRQTLDWYLNHILKGEGM